MHHSLRLYDQNRKYFLRVYITLAKVTRIPFLGPVARLIANFYGRSGHGGYILTLAESEEIIDAAKSVGLGPCSCRQVFHNCDHPLMSEILIGTVEENHTHEDEGFRHITKDEAKEIMRESHRRKLSHGIMRCGNHFYAICNCCTCCCVPTRLRNEFGIGQALIRNKNVVQDFKNHQLA